VKKLSAEQAELVEAVGAFSVAMRKALSTALYVPVKRTAQPKTTPPPPPVGKTVPAAKATPPPRRDFTATCLALFATDWLTMDPRRTALGRPSARALEYAARAGVPRAELVRQFHYLARTPPGRQAAQRAVSILQAKRLALTQQPSDLS
jgi:hypothetical protein